MCLLIQQTKETNFSDRFLNSTYSRNSDGIGVMWAEDGKLHYVKHLPKNAADALEFYRTHAQGKDCCVHYRMKTHGHIDFENCHPYPVFGFEDEHEMPMLLMHNGVLQWGNAKDTSKSDTWHFIRDHLRPLLSTHPDIVFEPQLIEMLGKYIGNNRFAIMNHEGKTAIINRNQGVMYAGAWLSNTYAWDYAGLHPDYKPPVYNTTSRWAGHYSGYDAKKTTPTVPAKAQTMPSIYDGSKKRGRGRKAKQTDLPLKDSMDDLIRLEVQEFMDDVSLYDMEMYELITFEQVRRLIRLAKSPLDPQELLQYWKDGICPDESFLKVVQGKISLTEALDDLYNIKAYELTELEAEEVRYE